MRALVCISLYLATVCLLKHYGDYGLMDEFGYYPSKLLVGFLVFLSVGEDILTYINKASSMRGR